MKKSVKKLNKKIAKWFRDGATAFDSGRRTRYILPSKQVAGTMMQNSAYNNSVEAKLANNQYTLQDTPACNHTEHMSYDNIYTIVTK